MKIKYKKIIIFLMLYSSTLGNHTIDNSLIITKDINFEVQIQDGVSIEGAYLDFGNLLRGSEEKIERDDFISFKSSFENDVIVNISFNDEDLSYSDENFSKFLMKKEGSEEINEGLEVYIKKIESYTLKKGEVDIPIKGEIRGVPKELELGRYKKTINTNVMIYNVF